MVVTKHVIIIPEVMLAHVGAGIRYTVASDALVSLLLIQTNSSLSNVFEIMSFGACNLENYNAIKQAGITVLTSLFICLM